MVRCQLFGSGLFRFPLTQCNLLNAKHFTLKPIIWLKIFCYFVVYVQEKEVYVSISESVIRQQMNAIT